MTRRHLFFLLVLMFPVIASAQMGGYGRGGGGGYGRGNGMGSDMGASNDSRSYVNICRVFGRVVDSTGQPLKDVSIILQQQDNDPNPMPQGDEKPEDPYYKELTTKKNGKFTFSSLPFYHQYKLTIMADGYKRWEQDVRFIPKQDKQKPAEQFKDTVKLVLPPRAKPSPDKDLGDVKLTLLPKK